jgi:hypothetical protein
MVAGELLGLSGSFPWWQQQNGDQYDCDQRQRASSQTRERVRIADWSVSFTSLKQLNLHFCDSQLALRGCRPL